MNRREAAVAELEGRLGYAFADPALLERALTHASVGQGARGVDHNQTLEFLGDRVLGLLAAEALVALNAAWREGELSRRLVAVVSGTACAHVARRIGLGEALRLAGATSQQGGRDNDRILGDAIEAVMAAVYLDGGLEAARGVFETIWGETLTRAADDQGLEPKTALQEWAMARGLPLPAYSQISRAGPPHAPTFTVAVTVQGFPAAQASGVSLRAAQKAAAAVLLLRERGQP